MSTDKGSSDARAAELPASVNEGANSLPDAPDELLSPSEEFSEEDREKAKRAYLVRRFRLAARGLWGRKGDRLAWPLTIGLLLLILIDVALKYGINVWNRAIFDALESRESSTVFVLSAIFIP